ncbi:DUF3422 family protein [Amaricoccus sp.]|uniref:DUF3422 family protein n=1 Tax=Amaricoccus sp. TaxID=1872485 RepID=UPI001B43E7D0|nr:DUF3422 domain-containing protein [Amaricoccus sp.]MBP7002902.1 DUF3422 domain-containing protein [Amaricoccus sp.]
MAQLAIQDHPNRYALANELHARPFPEVDPPCRAAHLAIKKPGAAADRDRSLDFAHLVALLDRYGAAHPAPGANHYSGKLGRGFLKWEMHTEFVTYTLFVDQTADEPFSGRLFDLFPADWLAAAPGACVSSCIVEVESVAPEDLAERLETFLPRWFVMESVAASRVLDGDAVIMADFRIDENGHSRMAVFAHPAIGRRRLGRVMQRLVEIETYKAMAMLTLPQARMVASAVARLDRDLSGIVAGMAGQQGGEGETLDQLLKMAAEIEHLASAAAFRFGAAGAYEAIVSQRIQVLREERIGGRQLFSEFMMRRFDPAMRTCRSAKERLDELSARAERASDLLRTRVDVANQAQNVEVLRAMDRRAALQLRLQETVEGLSVVAISYYAVNLVAGLLGPAGERIGLEKPAILAALTVPVVLVVWLMVRRIRARAADRREKTPPHG